MPTPLTHDAAERRVKALQKEFLLWAEDHASLAALPADAFDLLRRHVFRGTFAAFRFGIVGLPAYDDIDTSQFMHGWCGYPAPQHPAIQALVSGPRMIVAERYLRATLEAFRLGALVAAGPAPARRSDAVLDR